MTPAPSLNPLGAAAMASPTPGTALPATPPRGASVPAPVAAEAQPLQDQDPVARVALTELAEVLRTTTIGLRFEIDETTNKVITMVVDKETGELIRQIPSEEVMRFARALDKLQGVFVSQLA